jgi:hypothetical protein
MKMSNDPIASYIKILAQQCVARVDGLGLGNKQRAADAALHFFLGGAVVARAIGEENKAAHIERIAAFLIATRGMSEVRELAARPVVRELATEVTQ